MNLTLCTSAKDMVRRFEKCEPVPVLNLGDFYTAQGGRTISIDEEKWLKYFKTRDYEAESPGIYCFWLMNDGNEFSTQDRTHWIQGKQYSPAKDRSKLIEEAHKICRGQKKDGGPTKARFIYHKTVWKFKTIKNHNRVPLYIGKSSNVINRIKLHLSWPNSFREPDKSPGFERVVKNNTSTQFRSCYEFLTRNTTWEKRIGENGKEFFSVDDKRFETIGISIIPNSFEEIQQRFFWENLLIGKYRPPFNVDSER